MGKFRPRAPITLAKNAQLVMVEKLIRKGGISSEQLRTQILSNLETELTKDYEKKLRKGLNPSTQEELDKTFSNPRMVFILNFCEITREEIEEVSKKILKQLQDLPGPTRS